MNSLITKGFEQVNKRTKFYKHLNLPSYMDYVTLAWH